MGKTEQTKYSKLEELKEKIEYERKKLDEIMLSGDAEKIYCQSVKLDKLLEQYIDYVEAMRVPA